MNVVPGRICRPETRAAGYNLVGNKQQLYETTEDIRLGSDQISSHRAKIIDLTCSKPLKSGPKL